MNCRYYNLYFRSWNEIIGVRICAFTRKKKSVSTNPPVNTVVTRLQASSESSRDVEPSLAEDFRLIIAEAAMIYRCLGRLIGSPLLTAHRDSPGVHLANDHSVMPRLCSTLRPSRTIAALQKRHWSPPQRWFLAMCNSSWKKSLRKVHDRFFFFKCARQEVDRRRRNVCAVNRSNYHESVVIKFTFRALTGIFLEQSRSFFFFSISS